MLANTRPMTERMAEFHKVNQHFLSLAPNDAKIASGDPNVWGCEKHLYFSEDGSGYYFLSFEIADTGHRHYLVASLTLNHWSQTEGLDDSILLTFSKGEFMMDWLKEEIEGLLLPASAVENGKDLIHYVAQAMSQMKGQIEFAPPIHRKPQQGDCA